MKHDNDEKHDSLKGKIKPNSISDSESRPAVRRTWQWTSRELKQALNQWDEMADKAIGPSPDEKILQDMQKLLSQLKEQLESLSK